jgi:hypothetical protein
MNDRERLEAIVAVVNKYLPPNGISKAEAMSQIIELVDPLPKQAEKPDAWIESVCALLRQAHDTLSLAQYPLRQSWVNLTDEEIEEIAKKLVNDAAYCSLHFAVAIQARFRRKNGG